MMDYDSVMAFFFTGLSFLIFVVIPVSILFSIWYNKNDKSTQTKQESIKRSAI